MAEGEPTPWIGLYERIAFSAYFVWLSVLAVALWRRQANGPRDEAAGDRMQAPPLRLPVPEAVHRYAANFDRSGQGLICQRSMPPLLCRGVRARNERAMGLAHHTASHRPDP